MLSFLVSRSPKPHQFTAAASAIESTPSANEGHLHSRDAALSGGELGEQRSESLSGHGGRCIDWCEAWMRIPPTRSFEIEEMRWKYKEVGDEEINQEGKKQP